MSKKDETPSAPENGPNYASNIANAYSCDPIPAQKIDPALLETYSMQSQLILIMKELELAKLQLEHKGRVA